MEPVIFAFIAAAILAVLVGVGAGLVVKRRRGIPGLEPPADSPGLPDSIREDVAREKAAMLERIEERERMEQAAAEAKSSGGQAAPAAGADQAGVVPTPGALPPSGDMPGVVEGAGAGAGEPAEPAEPDLTGVVVDAGVGPPVAAVAGEAGEATGEAPAKPRFRDRLAKARQKLAGAFGSLRRGKIDDDTWDELEYALIGADVGVEATHELLDHLRSQVKEKGLTDGGQLLDALKDEMKSRLAGFDLDLLRADSKPSVWLFVGVNGVGKTTTIGKLGKRETDAGRSVVMAAGDTFRAAAAEQLQMWADRAGADCVRGNEGGDPSAVIFDAVESAAAKGADLVLADTAGRLHTKVNLMEELRKVRRVADKGAGTVSEVLLVLDATTGQNGLVQAQQFTDAVELTGVVLTKLDGSAKGGIVFAIQQNLGIPVKLVGLGESAEDLVPFDAGEFVDALFED